MRILVSDRHRLVYVSNPKAASTSIHRIFLKLAGIDPDMATRKAFRNAEFRRRMGEAGLRQEEVGRKAQANGRYGDYFWFTFVRDPYSRTVSNYNNKLNRYAREFEGWKYLKSKFRQILAGPEAWRSHMYAVRYLQRRISFARFVNGLYRHGVGFDAHFRVQKRIVEKAHVDYDYIGKVETFERDIRRILIAAGIDDQALLDSVGKTRENASDPAKSRDDDLTPKARRRIRALYAADFKAFGYPTGRRKPKRRGGRIAKGRPGTHPKARGKRRGAAATAKQRRRRRDAAGLTAAALGAGIAGAAATKAGRRRRAVAASPAAVKAGPKRARAAGRDRPDGKAAKGGNRRRGKATGKGRGKPG